MTAKPILARYDRLRTVFRSRHTARSFNLANVFLTCCLAADSQDGIMASLSNGWKSQASVIVQCKTFAQISR